MDYKARQGILQHDSALAHQAKSVLDTIKGFANPAPSDCYLFSLMGQALPEQHFDSYKDDETWVSNWLPLKDKPFYSRRIHKLL